MNYLAHSLLAEHNYDSVVGSFIADFIKGPVPDHFPEQMRSGIRLHREIDVYTDSHPVVKTTIKKLDPVYGRYRGIILDVFYDYILACNFDDFSDMILEDFSRFTFYAITHNWNYLPQKVQLMAPNLIGKNWFTGYRKIENITRALYFLRLRSKRAPEIEKAVTDLVDKKAMIEESFRNFFPELIRYADERKSFMRKSG